MYILSAVIYCQDLIIIKKFQLLTYSLSFAYLSILELMWPNQITEIGYYYFACRTIESSLFLIILFHLFCFPPLTAS